jgi:tRNA (guanine-N7-)-methyltransferase
MSTLANPPASLVAANGAKLAPPSSASASLVYRPVSYVEPLPLDTLFARPQPLEVELGSGDGGFLLAYAAAHPEVNFLGVERLLGRLRKLDRKGLRAKLTNLRLLRLEASYVITCLLPVQSVQALHVYCPDPWPKRRHQKRRLINEEFIQAVGRVLEPGGFLYLRTDDQNYHEQMSRVCGQPFLEAVETPVALAGLTTDFERGFLAEGRPIHRLAYRLGPTPTRQ